MKVALSTVGGFVLGIAVMAALPRTNGDNKLREIEHQSRMALGRIADAVGYQGKDYSPARIADAVDERVGNTNR